MRRIKVTNSKPSYSPTSSAASKRAFPPSSQTSKVFPRTLQNDRSYKKSWSRINRSRNPAPFSPNPPPLIPPPPSPLRERRLQPTNRQQPTSGHSTSSPNTTPPSPPSPSPHRPPTPPHNRNRDPIMTSPFPSSTPRSNIPPLCLNSLCLRRGS